MLELAVIRWECLLRIVSNRPQGTNFQLLQSVLSSWPHQLSIPLSVIESKISPSLSFYRRKTANNEFVQNFLSIHGEDKLARFRQVIVQFRSASAILGQFWVIFVQFASIANIFWFSRSPPNCSELTYTSTEETSYWIFQRCPRLVSWTIRCRTNYAMQWQFSYCQCRRHPVCWNVNEEKSKDRNLEGRNWLVCCSLDKIHNQNRPSNFEPFRIWGRSCWWEPLVSWRGHNERYQNHPAAGSTRLRKDFNWQSVQFYRGRCVDWNDPFRFLLKEDGQGESESISVYEIRYAKGFRILFSLTVVYLPIGVDTPSHDVSEILGNILQSGAIQQLELIALVSPANSVPSPSCESFLSLLGKDLKENVNWLWTFADVKEESLESDAFVGSLPLHDFHNFEFLSSNEHCDPYSRVIYWKSFLDFFDCLSNSNPNRLSETKKSHRRKKTTGGDIW